MGKSGFIGGNQGNRAELDFYPTPPYAVEELLKQELFEGDVWECACGDGAISEELKRHNFEVYSSDIVDRGYGEKRNLDFLNDELTQGMTCDNIITNPPFKCAKEFVEKAMKVTKKKSLYFNAWLFSKAKTAISFLQLHRLKQFMFFLKGSICTPMV